MDIIEGIKESIAQEKGYEDYSQCLLQHTHSFCDLDSLINEVISRYVSECVKASLEKASQNAIAIYDGDYLADVQKESITNEENIVLL